MSKTEERRRIRDNKYIANRDKNLNKRKGRKEREEREYETVLPETKFEEEWKVKKMDKMETVMFKDRWQERRKEKEDTRENTYLNFTQGSFTRSDRNSFQILHLL